MGVANDRSIAWGISTALAEQGATLAFTFQGEALEKRVRPLADSLGSTMVLLCDVNDPGSINAAFAAIDKEWGGLDFVVHAIAYSDKDELKGKYVDTSPENFAMTMNISCYSFTAVCQLPMYSALVQSNSSGVCEGTGRSGATGPPEVRCELLAFQRNRVRGSFVERRRSRRSGTNQGGGGGHTRRRIRGSGRCETRERVARRRAEL